MSRFTVTLNVPMSVPVPLGKGTGKHTIVPISDFNQDVWEKAFVNGFVSALGDISRGFSDKAKKVPNTDEVFATARQKRVDAWLAGTWATIERADSDMALAKDQYYAEALAERFLDAGKVDAEIKATVEANLPAKTKATFANFLLALATGLDPDGDDESIREIADSVEAALVERALEAKKLREESAKKVKVPALTLEMLLKKKK